MGYSPKLILSQENNNVTMKGNEKEKNGKNRKVTNFEMDLAVSFALHRTQAKRYEGRSRCRSYHLRPGDVL